MCRDGVIPLWCRMPKQCRLLTVPVSSLGLKPMVPLASTPVLSPWSVAICLVMYIAEDRRLPAKSGIRLFIYVVLVFRVCGCPLLSTSSPRTLLLSHASSSLSIDLLFPTYTGRRVRLPIAPCSSNHATQTYPAPISFFPQPLSFAPYPIAPCPCSLGIAPLRLCIGLCF